MKQKMKLTMFTILALGIIVAGCDSSQGPTGKISAAGQEFKATATIYNSSTCGCCGLYSNYLSDKSDMKVDVNEIPDVTPIKEKHGVPQDLQSCHTTVIGDYFVEGHVPLEAIDKLLTEKPDIAGIAMSGMPSGSPGMPGGKTEPFVIYAVSKDGSYEEFMTM